MTKVCMGYAVGYGPYLKIMVNDEDDPVLTDDLDYSKFLFNSKTDKLGYVWDIITGSTTPYPQPGSGATTTWVPLGSNFDTFEQRIYNADNAREFTYSLRNIYGNFNDDLMVPLTEIRKGNPENGRWYGPSVKWFQSGESGIRFAGTLRGEGTAMGWTPSRVSNAYHRFQGTTDGSGGLKNIPNVVGGLRTNGSEEKWAISVWNLPGNNRPIDAQNDTPTPGQQQIRIDKDVFKIARDGFTTAATDKGKLILSSDWVPAKVMRTGEVTIAAGAYIDVTTPLTLTDATVLDYIVRRSGYTYTHPPALQASYDESTAITVQYAIAANYVRIYNTSSFSIDVRYVIYADDNGAETSGGTQVVRKANDGVQDYIQFKRPGSSDTDPALNEIYLDTRLAYLPLIDEGYFTLASMGESPTSVQWGNRAKTISFDNTGFFPFVKYATVFSQADGKQAMQIPHFHLLYTSTSYAWQYRPARGSTLAEVQHDYIKFHAASDSAPNYINVQGTAPFYIPQNYTQEAGEIPIGIRYYIFALPTSL